MPSNMDFGQRLKKLRREQGWTQAYVSSHLAVTRSTYAYYEISKIRPDYETLTQLTCLFHVSINFLITGEESISESEQRLIAAYRHITNPVNRRKILEFVELKVFQESSKPMEG